MIVVKKKLKDLLQPITSWYTGSLAVETSSLHKFSMLEGQLKALKNHLESIFERQDAQQEFSAEELRVVRYYYKHIDELDLWGVMTNPQSVKSVATDENADLKRLKYMSKELLDALKGKIDPATLHKDSK